MMIIKTGKSLTQSVLLVLVLLILLSWGAMPALGFDVKLWPDGRVSYRFDTGTNNGTTYTDRFSDVDKARVQAQMATWVSALTIGGREYIRFDHCPDNNCISTSYVCLSGTTKKRSGKYGKYGNMGEIWGHFPYFS